MRVLIFALLLSVAVVFAACGSQPATTDNVPPAGAESGKVNDISAKEAFPKTQAAYAQFIDVRTPAEYADGHADRAVNIPLATFADNLDRIEKNEPVYLICNSGRQSTEAGQILAENGYQWVFSVEGGTAAWRDAGLPVKKAGEAVQQ